MRALLVALLIAGCTPKPRDRTETCVKYVDVMERCDGNSGASKDVWVGRCKVSFTGDPNGATPSEAEIMRRMRSIAACAETVTACSDYEKCKDAARATEPR